MSKAILKRVTPYVITLALASFLYQQADGFDIVSQGGRPGPDLWPKMACVLLAIASAAGLFEAFFAGRPVEECELGDEAEAAIVSPPETHPHLVWICVGATGLYVFALPWAGFFVSTLCFAMALLVIGGMRRWAWVPGTGLALATVFTLIFMKVVYVALPLGQGIFKTVSLGVFALLGIH